MVPAVVGDKGRWVSRVFVMRVVTIQPKTLQAAKKRLQKMAALFLRAGDFTAFALKNKAAALTLYKNSRRMVEAQRIELWSQVAIAQASTSIADLLVLARGTPIGRLSVARSSRFGVRVRQEAVRTRDPECLTPHIPAPGKPEEDGPPEGGAVTD